MLGAVQNRSIISQKSREREHAGCKAQRLHASSEGTVASITCPAVRGLGLMFLVYENNTFPWRALLQGSLLQVAAYASPPKSKHRFAESLVGE